MEKDTKKDVKFDVDACIATCGQSVINAACLLSVLRSKMPLEARMESATTVAELATKIDELCRSENDSGLDATEIMAALLYLFVRTHEYLVESDREYSQDSKWVEGILRVRLPEHIADKDDESYERRPIPYDPSVG